MRISIHFFIVSLIVFVNYNDGNQNDANKRYNALLSYWHDMSHSFMANIVMVSTYVTKTNNYCIHPN